VPGSAVPVVSATETSTLVAEDADTGLVCAREKRPGSRIAADYCYSLPMHAARRAVWDEQIRAQMEEAARERDARQRWDDMGKARRRHGF
jgi:hypothetical protein